MKTEPRPPKKKGRAPLEGGHLVPIPKPPAKPVVGHMLDLDPNAPIQTLMELARKMGPIFELDVMG
jgi:cytochrome P450/NADPH-cytochrome P450 reductase